MEALDWLTQLTNNLTLEVEKSVPKIPFLVHTPFTKENVNTFLEQIYVEDSRTLVLIGKSGAGKTNLLNHLCSAPIFVSQESANSITRTVQKAVIRSQISDRREVKFEIFDTPGLFDTTLDNETITKTMNKFFLYDCSQVHLVFIMIKQDRVTGEFQTLLTSALSMFQKPSAPILRLVITHSEMKTRPVYQKSFFSSEFIRKLIAEWNFKQENFIFVDLNLQDTNYRGESADVANMCQALMNNTVPFHKTEVFSQFTDEKFSKQYSAVTNPVGLISSISDSLFWNKKSKDK